MGWVKATDTNGLSAGKTKKAIVDGIEILFANVGGKYYAIANKCPHMGGSLSDGTMEGGIITCPKHGSKFDVKTGTAVGDAKLLFLRMKVKDTRSYRVKTEGKTLFVEMD
jgi:3-phenylpropionate/trans-cinnamate dioxygenase ferredoxin component